jgi:hypothetical protein
MSQTPDPLLEKARTVAEAYGSTLPDYVCEESIERFQVVGAGSRSRTVQLDTVAAEVVYEQGKETFRNLRINGKATDKTGNGIWSVGVFGPMMVSLFDPRIEAELQRRGTSTQMGRRSVRYDFAVKLEKSNWQITGGGDRAMAAYRGSIWVDANTGQILRHEMRSVRLPPKFFFRDASMMLQYGPVRINGKEYLLPHESQSKLCPANANSCESMRATYKNCRKFSADSTLKFDE